MSFYVIESEYDIDLAVKECMKLISLDRSRVKLAFNNMHMVHIFMNDLTEMCNRHNVDPEEKDFHMDVLVGEMLEDDDKQQ
jgi:hypothetical protein